MAARTRSSSPMTGPVDATWNTCATAACRPTCPCPTSSRPSSASIRGSWRPVSRGARRGSGTRRARGLHDDPPAGGRRSHELDPRPVRPAGGPRGIEGWRRTLRQNLSDAPPPPNLPPPLTKPLSSEGGAGAAGVKALTAGAPPKCPLDGERHGDEQRPRGREHHPHGRDVHVVAQRDE